MIGIELVRPLEADWQETLDATARAHGWPSSHDVAKLGKSVADLSAAYNDPARARATMSQGGAARLGFAFARDVPKGAGAVRELLSTGALRSEGLLRVLDVGAGLGAMTWGFMRALRAKHSQDRTKPAAEKGATVEATWVDSDAGVAEVAMDIVRRREKVSGEQVRVRSLCQGLDVLGDLGTFDLVLVGNVLSELGVALPDPVRIGQHVTLLEDLLEAHTEADGALVVVEPALRERARHLHRVRDALSQRGARIFAPCLHGAPCPALERESDWCHEDLPVDLPGWLVPVARAAGLRFEGLTFSYLVLKKGGPCLADAVEVRPGAGKLRVVSDVMSTKGKTEVFLCGGFSAGSPEQGVVTARKCVSRLHRHEPGNRQGGGRRWDNLERGDLVVIDPAPSLGAPRVGPSDRIEFVDTLGPRHR